MQVWKRMHIILTLQSILELENVYDLTFMIIQSFTSQKGLVKKETTKRIIWFSVDGTFLFQGHHIEGISQLKKKYSPMMGQQAWPIEQILMCKFCLIP
jgi:hypothetical protein